MERGMDLHFFAFCTFGEVAREEEEEGLHFHIKVLEAS